METYELDGQEQELLRISCRGNDLYLFKAFADQWGQTVGEARKDISETWFIHPHHRALR